MNVKASHILLNLTVCGPRYSFGWGLSEIRGNVVAQGRKQLTRMTILTMSANATA